MTRTKLTKLDVTKVVVGLVSSVSAGFVVETAIKTLIPIPLRPIQKIGFVIGTAVISGIVGDKAHDYAVHTISTSMEIAKIFKEEWKTTWKEAQEIQKNKVKSVDQNETAMET